MGAFDIGSIGAQAANSALGMGLGIATANWQDKRQQKQTQALQDIQMRGAKEMAAYNQQLAYDMWQKTAYVAQKEQMKQAGLNPALMYGMGGGGTQTIGAPNAGAPNALATGGSGEIQAGMGIMLQQRALAADVKVKEAQADNIKATTEKLKGVDTEKTRTEISSILQGIENAKAQEVLTEYQTRAQQLDNQYNAATIEHRKGLVYQAFEQAEELTAIIKNDRAISDATKTDKVNQVKANVANTVAETVLKNQEVKASIQSILESKSRVQVNDATVTKWTKEILQGWQKLEYEGNLTHAQIRQIGHNIGLNDMTNSEEATLEVVKGVLQAIGLGQGIKNMTGGTRNKIGFK